MPDLDTEERVAHHEAGHAVVAAHHKILTGEASIVPGTSGVLGHVISESWTVEMLTELYSNLINNTHGSFIKRRLANLDVALGGLLALEMLAFEQPEEGFTSDIESIRKEFNSWKGRCSDAFLLSVFGRTVDDFILRRLGQLKGIIKVEHIKAVARALLEKKVLTSYEVYEIIHLTSQHPPSGERR